MKKQRNLKFEIPGPSFIAITLTPDFLAKLGATTKHLALPMQATDTSCVTSLLLAKREVCSIPKLGSTAGWFSFSLSFHSPTHFIYISPFDQLPKHTFPVKREPYEAINGLRGDIPSKLSDGFAVKGLSAHMKISPWVVPIHIQINLTHTGPS